MKLYIAISERPEHNCLLAAPDFEEAEKIAEEALGLGELTLVEIGDAGDMAPGVRYWKCDLRLRRNGRWKEKGRGKPNGQGNGFAKFKVSATGTVE